MKNVGDIEEAAKYLASEYGHDTSIILRLYDDNGKLTHGDYCLSIGYSKNGTMILSNLAQHEIDKPKKEEEEEVRKRKDNCCNILLESDNSAYSNSAFYLREKDNGRIKDGNSDGIYYRGIGMFEGIKAGHLYRISIFTNIFLDPRTNLGSYIIMALSEDGKELFTRDLSIVSMNEFNSSEDCNIQFFTNKILPKDTHINILIEEIER